MDTRLYQFAERYTQAGFACIPVWPDRRKNPRLSSFTEYRETLPTLGDWQRWARRFAGSNLAILTGYHAGLCALDFDDVGSYNAWSMGVNDKWRDTWMVKSGRGYHVYFIAQGEPGKDRYFVRGHHEVLLRAKGAYIIAPPSIHYSGVAYHTTKNTKPVETQSRYILAGWKEKVESKKSGARPATTPVIGPQKLSILDYIPAYSTRPNGRGAFKAFCPFHDDTNPSAWVNPAQNRFGCNACFGGKYFDVVNVVSMLSGVDNNEIMKMIRHGEPLPPTGQK